MLAEIFVLRLEAILRFSQEAPASSRFVPLRALLHPKGKSPADGAVSTASSLELAPCPVGQFGQNALSLGVTSQRFRHTATQMQPISIVQLLQPYYPNSIVMPSTAGHLPPWQFVASTSALA